MLALRLVADVRSHFSRKWLHLQSSAMVVRHANLSSFGLGPAERRSTAACPDSRRLSP